MGCFINIKLLPVDSPAVSNNTIYGRFVIVFLQAVRNDNLPPNEAYSISDPDGYNLF